MQTSSFRSLWTSFKKRVISIWQRSLCLCIPIPTGPKTFYVCIMCGLSEWKKERERGAAFYVWIVYARAQTCALWFLFFIACTRFHLNRFTQFNAFIDYRQWRRWWHWWWWWRQQRQQQQWQTKTNLFQHQFNCNLVHIWTNLDFYHNFSVYSVCVYWLSFFYRCFHFYFWIYLLTKFSGYICVCIGKRSPKCVKWVQFFFV